MLTGTEILAIFSASLKIVENALQATFELMKPLVGEILEKEPGYLPRKSVVVILRGSCAIAEKNYVEPCFVNYLMTPFCRMMLAYRADSPEETTA